VIDFVFVVDFRVGVAVGNPENRDRERTIYTHGRCNITIINFTILIN